MYSILLIIFAMLLLERLTVTTLCRHDGSRALIRNCRLFHPNAISLMRIPQGIVSVIIACQGHWKLATLWFAFWMITDLSDGTIARYCDLGSETGKWLDPFSDKCMTFPPLLLFCLNGTVRIQLDLAPVAVYILIDIIGQCSRLFSKKKAANLFGKGKTAMITILLAALALNQIEDIPLITPKLASLTLYACIILAFLSCYCKIIPDIWYANTFTLANFLCGLMGIYQAWHHHFLLCLVYVFVGQFFDLYDGRMARKYGSTKRGALFDDIADATSFGLAIGLSIFKGLRSGTMSHETLIVSLLSLFYILCLFYRLYRFMKPTRPMPKGIFQGMPSPAGAMLAGSAVLVAHEIGKGYGFLLADICVASAAILMISNVPYSHFGQTIWSYSPRFFKMILFIVVILLTIFAIASKNYRAWFIWSCFGAALFYLIYGIQKINRLTPPAHPEED